MILTICLLAVSTVEANERTVAALGRIVPGEGVINLAAPGSAGGQAMVAELRVGPGSRVQKDSIVAVLTSMDAYKAALQRAEKEVVAAETGVTLAEAEVTLLGGKENVADKNIAVLEAEVARAQVGVKQAEAAVSQAQSSTAAARQRLQGERAEHDRIIEEYDPGKSDRVEIDFQKRVLELEEAKLDTTSASEVATLRVGVEQAQASLASAQARLEAAQAEREALSGQQALAQARVSQAQAQVAVYQAAAEQAKSQLAQGLVKSPVDALVLTVNAQPGEAVGPLGVVTLAQTQSMFVAAEVYVDEIGLVVKGMPATIKGAALGDTVLEGEVVRVGQQVAPNDLFSRDPTAFADTRVVPVRIKVTEPEAVRSLIGAQVTVNITPKKEVAQ
ncbi:MAG: HlyD family efflux transporter periplasmic adaptor subunit [Verrucomicrobiota bacterium]